MDEKGLKLCSFFNRNVRWFKVREKFLLKK